ncbi:MAG: hypothetical protein KJ734_07550, partial [Chloroflexi bacterium]|nr:hypothetical protein [Chloroflexota bacterium]
DVGDTVQVKDAEVTVLSLAGRRIKRVRVTKLAEPDPLNADAAPGD